MTRTSLVLSAVLSVAAFLPGTLAAAPPSDPLLLIPGDSVSVGCVRLSDLRRSPLADGLFRDLDEAHVDGDAARFLAEAGLRPSEDVDAVWFALLPAPAEGSDSSGLVVFEGRFDQARLASAVALRGATRRMAPGGESWLLPRKEGEKGKGGAVAFLDRHVVLAGTPDAVAKVLAARAAGGSGFGAGSGLGRQLSRVEPGASAWFLVDMTRFPKARAAMPRARARAEGDARPVATLISAMKSVTLLAGSARASGDSLKLTVTGLSPDAETRENLEDSLRGVLAIFRMAVQDRKPELVPVLRKFKVERDREGVTVSGRLPAEAVKSLAAGEVRTPRRPVHTYSIVARDPATGELGVAVQSHWFSVGSSVPWAEAGVGAVATQSFVDPTYGKLGLDLMRAGRSAPEALKGLLAADEGRDVRQVAMVDAQGRVASHTGAKCIKAAGHHVGSGWSVQANLMRSEAVWPAMAKAFESAKGSLAERLLAALEAAEAAGGDIRGRQSAALIVVSGKPTGKPWLDRVYDLRVDDSPAPLPELRRLVRLQTAYNLMNAGDLAVEKGDADGALKAYGDAGAMFPMDAEMAYWHAVSLVGLKRVDESLPLFRKAFRLEPSWVETTRRLPGAGLLPDDPALLKRIVAEVER